MSLDTARPLEQPVSGSDDLISYFRGAEKPRGEHRVGLEHEKLLFDAATGAPVPYEGARGIGALLEALGQSYVPFRERPDGPIIALQRGDSTISLEPGGQLELSGTAARSAREVHGENLGHLEEVRQAARQLGLQVVAL